MIDKTKTHICLNDGEILCSWNKNHSSFLSKVNIHLMKEILPKKLTYNQTVIDLNLFDYFPLNCLCSSCLKKYLIRENIHNCFEHNETYIIAEEPNRRDFETLQKITPFNRNLGIVPVNYISTIDLMSHFRKIRKKYNKKLLSPKLFFTHFWFYTNDGDDLYKSHNELREEKRLIKERKEKGEKHRKEFEEERIKDLLEEWKEGIPWYAQAYLNSLYPSNKSPDYENIEFGEGVINDIKNELYHFKNRTGIFKDFKTTQELEIRKKRDVFISKIQQEVIDKEKEYRELIGK